MSLNSFRNEFIDPNSRARSPTRIVDAIELIPESPLVLDIAALLNRPLPPPQIDSSHRRPQYRQPALRTQRRKPSTKTNNSGNASKRAAPKASRHSHSNSVGSSSSFHQPPPLSPIDTLASVASFEATSPHFGNAPLFYSPTRGDSRNHAQMSPPTHPYPAHAWSNTQYADYNQGFDDRPSKRARSEMAPSPQQASPIFNQGAVRPATSYNASFGWNVEQSIDNRQRMSGSSNQHYGQHSIDQNHNRMDDAELLLSLAYSSRAGSSRPTTNGIAHSPDMGRTPHQSTTRVAPSIPPFPYSAPQPSREFEAPQNEEHRMPGFGGSDIVDHDGLNGTLSGQTQTSPEEPVAPLVSAEEVDMGQRQSLLQQPAHVHYSEPELPNFMEDKLAPVEVTRLNASKSSKVTSIVPPKQLQSPPQSLLAEPKDLPTTPAVNDSSSFSTTGLLIDVPQAIWPTETRERRGSESHLRLGPQIQQSANDYRQSSVPLENPSAQVANNTEIEVDLPQSQVPSSSLNDQATRCAGCNWAPNSISEDKVDWLQCNGCKNWYHFACAGFNAKDIRRIDKFYCRGCKVEYGNTTFVRKSTRVHTTVDYAGLNEGVLRQSDDHPEHHYIEPIKNNKIQLVPETFPRMRAEDITADFLEKINFNEPILVPAHLNPRPHFPGKAPAQERVLRPSASESVRFDPMQDVVHPGPLSNPSMSADLPVEDEIDTSAIDEDQYELVPDDGQDGLDMVIPQGLTVRRVAQLYGPENQVPVIDVKSQEGDGKKWTVGKWADYYESTGDKVIRNVISLEVSKTPFGKLIRRPKVVRDLDLQDSVWPRNESRKSVGFYCLMSVADSYTDFHIDFGGSSVYYHILKGKKVFFFIPPTKVNLQKYEEWNTLASQNWTWLPDQTKTKECFRVDLYPGDTMLIPSGWIHSVWTPEDSLVIGGNFLTRLHYGMQFRIAEIEKNNKTGLAFRYPKFQKVMWYTILKYLEEDPLPSTVREIFNQGRQFERPIPSWQQFNKFGHNSDPGPENYHARYYPKAELEGLPEMVSYILRTVLIHLDCLEGISQTTRKAVSDSIPKNCEPLEVARTFTMWAAWKRGNESIPEWASVDGTLPTRNDGDAQKKLSNAQFKRLERAAAIPTPERQSVRIKTAQEISTTPKTSTLGPRRTACDACRKRKMRCKHIEASGSGSPVQYESNNTSPLPGSSTLFGVVIPSGSPPSNEAVFQAPRPEYYEPQSVLPVMFDNISVGGGTIVQHAETADSKKGRTKACDECRKSKVRYNNTSQDPLADDGQRRCVHDEFGNIDLVKKNEPPIPRGSAKRKLTDGEMPNGSKKSKKDSTVAEPSTMPEYSLNGSAQEALDQMAMMTQDQGATINGAEMDYSTTDIYNERPTDFYDYDTTANQAFDNEMVMPAAPMVGNHHSYPPEEEPVQAPSHFMGLQAIAYAATANAAESMLDPALFDTPTLPDAKPLTNGVEFVIEEPHVEETIENDTEAPAESMDIDIMPKPEVEPVHVDTVEERLLGEVAPVVAEMNGHQHAVEMSPAVEETAQEEAIAEPQTSSDSPVGGQDVDLVDVDVPVQEEQTPVKNVAEAISSSVEDAKQEDVELHVPMPTVEENAIQESIVHEPAVEEPTTEESTIDEPTIEESTAEETTIQETTPEESTIEEPMMEEPIVEEKVMAPLDTMPPTTIPIEEDTSVPAPHNEHRTSRASTVLSDAPDEHLPNGVEPAAPVEPVLPKPKRKYTRKSQVFAEPTENGVVLPPTEPAPVPSSKRVSSRHSKPIERLSTAQHAETEAWSTKKANKRQPLTNGHVTTPSIKSASPEVEQSRKKTPAKTPVAKTPAVKTPAKTPVFKTLAMKANAKRKSLPKDDVVATMADMDVENDEERDHRLAMQLHKEALGLRSRRGGS
ncbi:hypothetical protein EJ08DRAFT_692039 [Tothia fuscella]|uniref:JmjC domain-containing histone demethylation protein 1 n=1 Tax=Tothia fuscella TaxID=1048955 RepID=A0A9P4P2K7_9PEZI|nr:hypothetical protein EJ08DRAFT_692039 [Tothia fuscella]